MALQKSEIILFSYVNNGTIASILQTDIIVTTPALLVSLTTSQVTEDTVPAYSLLPVLIRTALFTNFLSSSLIPCTQQQSHALFCSSCSFLHSSKASQQSSCLHVHFFLELL